MGVITYKCPNCGGGLTFNAEKQKYKCEYCLSEFSQEELDEIEKRELEKARKQAEVQRDPEPEGAGSEAGTEEHVSGSKKTVTPIMYTCPSCGAQIVTDETTAASFCYYCHNPIVLEEKLRGEFKPDYVVPFQIDKKKAQEIFTQWVGRKKFVPDYFFSASQIESMTGVYFPYWLYSCQVKGDLQAEGNEPIIDQQTFDLVQKIRGNVRRYPDGWGEAAPLTGLLYCADCGGKMYVHRTNNGKRISQYTCSQYSKVPVGKLCTTQHRINEDVVLSLVSEMLKAIAEYAKHDRAEFVRVVQEAQSSQQTAEVKKQRTRLATAKQRVSELEVLLCKIYEDNILGKLSDSRYATLDAQYEKEQSELTAEISVLEKAVKSYEKHEKDADRFIALIDKYENFDKLTIAMLNEFIEKILVHERDRKGSIQTTQEVEIYFNFVGRFVPPAFGEVELTPEELEEIRKREERKDRLHQNYLKRKANGKQKEYEERTKAKKKAEIEARKQAIRTEDIARGVFIPVSSLPQLGPRKGA